MTIIGAPGKVCVWPKLGDGPVPSSITEIHKTRVWGIDKCQKNVLKRLCHSKIYYTDVKNTHKHDKKILMKRQSFRMNQTKPALGERIQQTKDVKSMLVLSWASVVAAGPT